MSNRCKHIAQYILNKSKYKYWGKRDNLICKKCGKKLNMGDWIVSKRRRSKINSDISRNLYHEDCAKELYLI